MSDARSPGRLHGGAKAPRADGKWLESGKVLAPSVPVRRGEPRWAWAVAAAVAATLLGAPAPGVQAAVPTRSVVPASAFNDGPAFPVSRLALRYAWANRGQPALRKILRAKLTLGWKPTGFCTAYTTNPQGQRVLRGDVQIIHTRFSALSQATARPFHATAIRSLARQLVARLNALGLGGVYVVVAPEDFKGDQDLRPKGDTTLHLLIHTAVVTSVRTIISGGRFVWQKEKINNPIVAKIPQYSPIQPAAKVKPGSTDLLETNLLNDYIDRLNRQPGRQVSVAISKAGGHAGKPAPQDAVNLDYLVHEQKPWHVYFQLSNTGTPQTGMWRERFGVVDNQLLGFDDILSVDYITAGFKRENSVAGSYNFPLVPSDRLRVRVYADYQGFSASDVGFPGAGFFGDETVGGVEGILNVFQYHRLFIDTLLGIRYEHIRVDNSLIQEGGTGDFIMPYLGFHLERYTPIAQSWADATLLTNYTTSNSKSLNNLGRLDVNRNWFILQGDAVCQFFLEPLLFPRSFESGTSTLANQIKISISGQEAFGYRLPAEDEMTAGGLYTVRGYPQSITAGDSVGIESFEYRLHVPQLFGVKRNPGTVFDQPFRWSPQEPYGPTDWDLIGKAFVDIGEVVNSNRQSYESDATLVGTGLGVELDLKQNVSLLADWGIALTHVGSSSTGNAVTPGSSAFNFVFTFTY